MEQKVYVVFHDHEDKYTDNYECQWDYCHDFISVCGTKEEANKVLSLLVLKDYYERCDHVDSEIERYAMFNKPMPLDVDFLRFSIVADFGDNVILDVDGDIETYYYEEYTITVPS